MDLSCIKRGIEEIFPSKIVSLDSHTAGEPTRLIVDGTGPIPGETMEEKRRYIMQNLDHVRLQVTREPRGHREIFAAIVTDPVTDGADFGLVFMDPRRYPFLCGHGTMGAVSTLIETGVLEAEEPETVVVVDTPSGPMKTVARVKGGQVESVRINMVPSFVYKVNENIRVSGLGEIMVDTLCEGGFFVMISSD